MSIIVSLTSTSERLDILRHTLMSLCSQTLKPDQIIVNLSREPYLYDKGIQNIPAWFKLFHYRNIRINWVKNIGPYRKLLPVLKNANKNDIIVTCDDDVIYGSNWLKKLLRSCNQFPDSLICGRARRPVVNIFNRHQSYINWPIITKSCQGIDLIPIGIGGVCYRNKLLDLNFIYSDEFKMLAPTQDDLWFKIASYRKGVEVRVAENIDGEVSPIQTKGSLYSVNASKNLKSSRHQFFYAIAERFALRSKSYLGIPICENDTVWHNLKAKYIILKH